MNVNELLGRISDHLSVGRAFGPAYEKDGTLVIPVALVAGGGGGGGGEGGAPARDRSATEEQNESGDDRHSVTGSGGGFGGVVLPVGVYVVSGENVRWKPAVNATMIALAAIGLLRVLARSRAVNQQRRGR